VDPAAAAAEAMVDLAAVPAGMADLVAEAAEATAAALPEVAAATVEDLALEDTEDHLAAALEAMVDLVADPAEVTEVAPAAAAATEEVGLEVAPAVTVEVDLEGQVAAMAEVPSKSHLEAPPRSVPSSKADTRYQMTQSTM